MPLGLLPDEDEALWSGGPGLGEALRSGLGEALRSGLGEALRSGLGEALRSGQSLSWCPTLRFFAITLSQASTTSDVLLSRE